MRIREHAVRGELLAALATLVAAGLVYAHSSGFGFVWDDREYLLRNPVIQGLSWQHLRAAFTQSFQGNYAPLHILWYMILFHFWELDPSAYHLMNVGLHAFNALFVFILTRKITGKTGAALFASLVFALHPVQVENVAWVSEAKTLLSVALCLPAFYLYLRYTETRNRWLCAASIALYGLSLLAKVATITYPLLLILYDKAYRGGFRGRDLYDKIPCLALAALLSIVALATQTSNREIFYFRDSVWITFLTTSVALLAYVRHVLLPVGLSPFYSFVHTRLGEPAVLLALVLVGAALWATVHTYRTNPRLGFWVAWFWVALLPNLNIVPLTVPMADRYLYFPLIGPAVLGGLVLLGSERIHASRLALAALFLLSSGSITATRTSVWADDVTLWSDTVTRTPREIPYNNLGAAYIKRGDVDKAAAAFEKAIEIEPAYTLPYMNLAMIARRRGDLAGAEAYLQRALRWDRRQAAAWVGLAKLFLARGDQASARTAVTQGLEQLPDEPRLLALRGHFLARAGRLDDAAAVYQGLCRRFPDRALHWYNLGAVERRRGHQEAATEALIRACRLDPGLVAAYRELAALFQDRGDYATAARYYDQALLLAPSDPDTLNNYAYLLAEHIPGEAARAVELARRALEARPGDPGILDTLGWALHILGKDAQAVKYLDQAAAAAPANSTIQNHLAQAHRAASRTLADTVPRGADRSATPAVGAAQNTTP